MLLLLLAISVDATIEWLTAWMLITRPYLNFGFIFRLVGLLNVLVVRRSSVDL